MYIQQHKISFATRFYCLLSGSPSRTPFCLASGDLPPKRTVTWRLWFTRGRSGSFWLNLSAINLEWYFGWDEFNIHFQLFLWWKYLHFFFWRFLADTMSGTFHRIHVYICICQGIDFQFKAFILGAGQLAKKPTRQNCFCQLAKLSWSSRQIPLVNSPNSFGQLAKK